MECKWWLLLLYSVFQIWKRFRKEINVYSQSVLNSSVEGKRYFQTMPMRATFVKPDKVTIGDFPEIDPFAEDDEDMEM